MNKLVSILAITAILASCATVDNDDENIFRFYKNDEGVFITDITNIYLSPIEIGYIDSHGSPFKDDKLFVNFGEVGFKVKGDSLVNIISRGRHWYFASHDTLYNNDSKTYTVNITRIDKPRDINSYAFVDLSYKILEGPEKGRKHSYYLLYRDEFRDIEIKAMPSDFDPFVHKSWINPYKIERD